MPAPTIPYLLDASKDYPFVASTEEHSRLNEQSAGINEMMLGKISQAPLATPTKILDVGCGTGIQTRLFAEMYPEAIVVGVDPNPVPEAEKRPQNVVFVLGSLEDQIGKHELLQPSSFDLVYCRYLVLAIHDWSHHIKSIKSLLKPNGWVEFQEIVICDMYDEHEQLVSQDWRYPNVIRRGGTERGLDFDIGLNFPSICRALGFVDIKSQSFPQVFRGGWKARPETDRGGQYFHWAAPPFFRMILARSARPEDGEDVEELVQEVETKLMNGPTGTHCKFEVVIARKPAEKT